MQQPVRPSLDSLSLHLEGLDADGGDMRINAFTEKLGAFRLALQEVDKHLSGIDKPTLDYLVTGLSHASPAAITLGTIPLGNREATNNGVVAAFCDLIKRAGEGKLRDAGYGHAVLKRVLSLSEGFGTRYKTMWLSHAGKPVASITEATAATVKDLLAKRVVSYGSVKGSVQWYNSHNKEKHFYLYPMLGNRVRCVFEEALREQASAAVEKSVIVYGTLTYWEGDFFPHAVNVSEIDILPPDDSLPTMSSLEGMAPGATGDQDAAEFIRSHRDRWH